MRIFISSKGVTSGDELHADLFQRRAAEREIVLQHPLAELLAEHRPVVLDAELCRAAARARGRSVAGVMRSTMPLGKATLSLIQSARPGSDNARQPDDGVAA